MRHVAIESHKCKDMGATHVFIPVGVLAEHAHAVLFRDVAASTSDMRRRILLTRLVWRGRETSELVVGTLDRHVMHDRSEEASQQIGKGCEVVHPPGY